MAEDVNALAGRHEGLLHASCLRPSNDEPPHLYVLAAELVLVPLVAPQEIERFAAVLDGVTDAVRSEDSAGAQLGERLPIEPRVVDQHAIVVDEIKVSCCLPLPSLEECQQSFGLSASDLTTLSKAGKDMILSLQDIMSAG